VYTHIILYVHEEGFISVKRHRHHWGTHTHTHTHTLDISMIVGLHLSQKTPASFTEILKSHCLAHFLHTHTHKDTHTHTHKHTHTITQSHNHTITQSHNHTHDVYE